MAHCRVCKMDFKIKEGQTAVTKHETKKKHLELLEKAAKKGENNVDISENQISIKQAFRNSEAAAKKSRDLKEAATKAESMLATWRIVHNLPETVFDCLSDLLPEIFPDSSIIKEMKLHSTKGSYLVTDGIAPHHLDLLIQRLRKTHFSINFDESTFNKTQLLNINVSVPDENNTIQKKHLTAIEVKDGSKGEQVRDKVTNKFEDLDIPLSNIVTDQTDGCPAMLGRLRGCHEFMKELIPTLPDLGGCTAHDAANIPKNGVKYIKTVSVDLVLLYKSIWANLEKHSAMKTKNFQSVSDHLGLIYKHVPKFIDVRFRYVLELAFYMEQNDRALYEVYSKLATDAAGGKEVSETEATIIAIYIKNYLLVRLLNKFIIFVVTPINLYIDFFESRDVRVHHRYGKMVTLMHDHLGLFLKEKPSVDANPAAMLKLNFDAAKDATKAAKDTPKFLSKKDVLIGKDARDFIKDLGLDVESPELRLFFDSVEQYFIGSSKAMQRYFKTGLNSLTLQYLSVLDPNDKNLPLDISRTKWIYLAKQFPNIVKENELDMLSLELGHYARLEEPQQDEQVDWWFGRLADMVEAGEKVFPVLSRLALALATIYNSSSETERDFRKYSQIFADSCRSSTSQLMLRTKLHIMSLAGDQPKKCTKCISDEGERRDKLRKGERVGPRQYGHCHCKFLCPDKELMVKLIAKEPAIKYKARLNKIAEEEAKEAPEREKRKKADKEAAARVLKVEVANLKKKTMEEALKRAKNAAAGKNNEENKKSKKRVAVKQVEPKEAKKSKLKFLTDRTTAEDPVNNVLPGPSSAKKNFTGKEDKFNEKLLNVIFSVTDHLWKKQQEEKL
jgi:hypothetical protein